VPSVLQAVDVCVNAGAPGITVHPRADERHIRADDVREIAAHLASRRDRVEFNIEGDPRPDFLALVLQARPHQCTLVPVQEGEITSQAGWSPAARTDTLRAAIEGLKAAGVRVSLFVDADPEPIRWAAANGADRVSSTPAVCARLQQGELAARASFDHLRRRRNWRLARARGRGPRSRPRQPPHLPRPSRIRPRCRSAMRSSATPFVGLDRAAATT
jgi:pyridoxine 5-phosphate synthase